MFQVAKKASVLKRRKSRQKLDSNAENLAQTDDHLCIDSSENSKATIGKISL